MVAVKSSHGCSGMYGVHHAKPYVQYWVQLAIILCTVCKWLQGCLNLQNTQHLYVYNRAEYFEKESPLCLLLFEVC